MFGYCGRNSQEKILSPLWASFVFQFLRTACTVDWILLPLAAGSTWTLVLKSATGVLNGLGFWRRLTSFSRPYGTAEAVPFHNSQRREFVPQVVKRCATQRRSVAGIYWGDGAGTSGFWTSGFWTSGWGASDLGAAGCRPRASKVRVFASP